MPQCDGRAGAGGGGSLTALFARAGLAAPGKRDEKAFWARLKPHIERALALRRRLSLTEEQNRLARVALDFLPTGVWLLGPGSVLIHANPAARRLMQRGHALVLGADGLPHAASALEDRRLQKLIGEALRAGAGPEAAAAILLGRNGGGSLHMMVTPLSVSESESGAALFAHDADSLPPHLETALRRCYGLTPTQAKLAAALASGESVADFAARARIGNGTARGHLKNLLHKTGARRQADLVRMIVTGPAMFCGAAERLDGE